jgi:hypothetical protein
MIETQSKALREVFSAQAFPAQGHAFTRKFTTDHRVQHGLARL